MEYTYLIILPLIIGYVLDTILGDPKNFPHIIVLFGNSISFLEKRLNKNKYRFIKGSFATLLLCSICFFTLFYLFKYIENINNIAYIIIASFLIFQGLANKSLIQEGKEVFKELDKGLNQGRKRLSWIVGRETDKLNKNQIKISVFETMSENLSDGVIAPLFYYAIGGVPAMLCYKMINTHDSMIGYKNDRYYYYGKTAAILDDIVNYIPARLTALLIALAAFSLKSFKFILKYGGKHSSPNAGYPEAALAGALNCRFGGPNYYHGKLVNKPYIGENNRNIENSEFKKVSKINNLSCFIFICIIIGIYVLTSTDLLI